MHEIDTPSTKAAVAAIAALAILASAGGNVFIVDVAGSPSDGAVIQAPDGTTVSLQPVSGTVNVGGTTTYDVVVDDATGGVGAYDLSVVVDDPDVASITAVDLAGDPPSTTTDVTITDGGTSVHLEAALADTADTGSVTIATVTVAGDSAGSSDLELGVGALGTEAGDNYVVTGVDGATVTVEEHESAGQPGSDPTPPDADPADDSPEADPGADGTGSNGPPGDVSNAVRMRPASVAVPVGDTVTIDVVAENVDGGVGAYDVTVTLDGPGEASIVSVDPKGDPSGPTTEVTLAPDGRSARVVAALADTADTGDVTIATVTVTGDTAGSSDLELGVRALGTEAGDNYRITSIDGASLSVHGPDSTGSDESARSTGAETEASPAGGQAVTNGGGAAAAGQDGAETDRTSSPDTAGTRTVTTTDGDSPTALPAEAAEQTGGSIRAPAGLAGFGVGVALVALALVAGLLAYRRT